ncbi:DUF928 domain-containing protein [Myxacorys almedinensis A]|uniref:DUF928 domain-containing protein n=2 Tax=Myxacorys TaxID=2056239 RepID=A0A8J7Z3Q0_9CYAN|nr:DUF928 domain-containing protein [Myxacorys almedinensis A]
MAKSVLKFRPPSRGTLSITRGGASRGGSEPVNQLQMIAPQTSIGYTTDAYPTLMVYIPKTSAKMMVLRIRTADGKKTLFKKEMAVPPMPGVVRVNFENASLPPLEVNSQYRWSVSLLANVVDRSTATLIEGKLERIQPDAMLSQRLAKATPQEKAFLYAESGVWWNALLTLDDLRKAQPDDVALSQHWMSLLDSVGMGAIAPTPILPTPDLKP